MNHADHHVYEFGPFRLDPHRHRLFRDGEAVLLPPKALDVLFALVTNAGRMLDRQTLIELVWGDTVVEDANLTVAVSHGRKALRDRGDTIEYIETIPRIGYRFVGEVHDVTLARTPLVIEKQTVSETVIEEQSDAPLASRYAVPALATAVLLVAAAIGTALYVHRANVTSPPPPIRSVAVLAPRPLSVDSRLTSLSLGVADALILRLGRLNNLTVRPMSAMVRYMDRGQDALSAGKALSVDAILGGTLQRADGRVRVRVSLIDVRRGTQLWAGTFDEADGDLFKLQDRMSTAVADALVPTLRERDRSLLAHRDTDTDQAYALYVLGDYYWNKRGGEVVKGIPYLQKAIGLDPNFARAYVRLAAIHAVTSSWSPEAEALIEKALQLDPTLADAHATYGLIRMFHKWDWAAAERALDRAVELDPNSSVAHHWRGVYLSLRGRLDEAKAEMQKALTLDPESAIITADIGQLYHFAREYDTALDYCRRALTLDPNFDIARNYITCIYIGKGMREKALSEFTSTADGRAWEANAQISAIFTGSGAKHVAFKRFESMMTSAHVPRDFFLWWMTSMSVIDGDRERALYYLDRGYREHIFLLPFINVDPFFDPLRNDPRFEEIVRRMGLRSEG
jgi:DNA-binding winged helix-turn-helix (wHTH) protein/TolB-like protein/Tfp pilus assembly protein PilF